MINYCDIRTLILMLVPLALELIQRLSVSTTTLQTVYLVEIFNSNWYLYQLLVAVTVPLTGINTNTDIGIATAYTPKWPLV